MARACAGSHSRRARPTAIEIPRIVNRFFIPSLRSRIDRPVAASISYLFPPFHQALPSFTGVPSANRREGSRGWRPPRRGDRGPWSPGRAAPAWTGGTPQDFPPSGTASADRPPPPSLLPPEAPRREDIPRTRTPRGGGRTGSDALAILTHTS